MGMSCSYFNNAFLMPAFNPEGKKFLGGEGGNRARELKEIGAKNFPQHCDAEVGYVWPIDLRDRFLSKIRPVLSFTVMNKFSFLVVSF